jgi:hypothetical protein
MNIAHINLFSIILLTGTLAISIISAQIELFDIKKSKTREFFSHCLSLLRVEKIGIWAELIYWGNQSTNIDLNKRLKDILRKEEGYVKLKTRLRSCERIFEFFYKSLWFVFFIDAILFASYFAFKDFFNKNLLLFMVTLVSFIWVSLGIYFLNREKDELDKGIKNIIPHPINLENLKQ